MLAYLAPLDVVSWIEADVFADRSTLSLRTTPSRNGQVKNVRYVSDFLLPNPLSST